MAWARQDSDPLRACPHLSAAFALLSQRWIAILVHTIAQHPARFSDLNRAVPGISRRVLTDKLDVLTRHGIVSRFQPPLGPAVYAITEDGRALASALEPIRVWATARSAGNRGLQPAPITDPPIA